MKGKLKSTFNISRLGLGAGILFVAAASAYMNVSGWAAMAETAAQLRANVALSSGFELTALFALPHAGRLMGRGTYAKALMALAIGAFAIGVNIYATQNFLFEQMDFAGNVVEGAQADLAAVNEQMSDLEAERQSIIERNDGVPRDVETIEESYDNLDEEENPINMMRRDSEIGDRQRYDEITAQLEELRENRTEASVSANDPVRSVIPAKDVKTFVTSLEIMKAFGLYVIGNNRLFWGPSYKSKTNWRGRRP